MEREEVSHDSRCSRPPAVVCRFGGHDVPDRVRKLSTFGAPDYIDSFTIQTPAAQERSAEGRACSSLRRRRCHGVPPADCGSSWVCGSVRRQDSSAAHVQGWRAITDTGANWIRLDAESWYLSAQAVCLVDDPGVSISLSLRHDRRPVGRFVWAFVEGPHQRAVPIMLRQAVALVADPLAECDRRAGFFGVGAGSCKRNRMDLPELLSLSGVRRRSASCAPAWVSWRCTVDPRDRGSGRDRQACSRAGWRFSMAVVSASTWKVLLRRVLVPLTLPRT